MCLKKSSMGSEPVSALSSCRIWTVWMIIVPHLRWRTFRYWAIRATDVRHGFESHWGHGTIPLLTLTLKTITTTLLLSKQAFSHLEDTSTMQTTSKKYCISYVLVHQCTVWNQNKVKKSGIGHHILILTLSASWGRPTSLRALCARRPSW
jgi:hypothetical protein